MRHSAALQSSQKQMADDETNRMYFNNLIGRPTYEREHLNLGKTGDFCKTNPSQLRRVSPPAPATRKNKWRTDETNHVHIGVKRAAGNRLTYEKRAARLQKTSHSYKTNHPGFPATVRRPSPLVRMNGKPTKRIVCTSATEQECFLHTCPGRQRGGGLLSLLGCLSFFGLMGLPRPDCVGTHNDAFSSSLRGT